MEPLEERFLLSTLRIASWNTMNAPDDPVQDAHFATVLSAMASQSVQGYAGPVDILTLAETDPPSAIRVRNILNTLDPSGVHASIVSGVDFGGDATGFVYRTTSVSLLQSTILDSGFTHQVLRGNFRPVGTLGESDFYVYAVHLKSGTTAEDQQRREEEMTLIRQNADALGDGAHVIVAGDFNMQSSFEGAWTVATSVGNAQLVDAANAPGNWSNNNAFQRLHTQNTAFMLRRLDLHMFTQEVDDGVGFDYVDNSFRAFGNNATHGLGNPITSGTGASPAVLNALLAASDHLPIVADYFVPPTNRIPIQQSGDSTVVREDGNWDSYRIRLATNPIANVTITVSPPAGLDLGNGPGQPLQRVFTPTTGSIPQTIVVRAVDDQLSQGNRWATITHSASSADPYFNGYAMDSVLVLIIDDEAPPVLINEVDSDTLGIDNHEFIELYDGGFGNTSLDGMVVVLYDGDTDTSYLAIDLQGRATNADGYFVIGSAGVPTVGIVLPDETIQNGADAIALYWGSAASFPNGSPITLSNLIDAVVYDTDDPLDLGLLTLLFPGQPQINENANNRRNFESVSRRPDSGLPRQTDNYAVLLATPGRTNVPVPAAILVTDPDGVTSVAEGGPADGFWMELAALPRHDVIVTLTPDVQLDLGSGAGVPVVRTFTRKTGVAPQWVTVLAVDDNLREGPHEGRIAVTVSSSDPEYAALVIPDMVIPIRDNDVPYLVINELDSDTPGTDLAEFVELYDGGIGDTPLDGLVVVFFNGANDMAYAAFDLDGHRTNANGFFLLGNAAVPGVQIVFPSNTLQNGADAVALYNGNPADFPAVTTANLLDAVVYGTDDPDDPGLLVLLLPGQPQVNESGGGNSTLHSIARVPDGGVPRETTSYVTQLPTPGTFNSAPPVPTGDFNFDAVYNCLDIDLLVAKIVAGTHPQLYDLTGDGWVNVLDLNEWRARAGAVNLPSGNPYLPADANLDGVVDGSDFGIWNSHKFSHQAAWCKGDFNADGVVDGSDFGIWNANKFQAADIPKSPLAIPMRALAFDQVDWTERLRRQSRRR